jgi:Ribbon-helix-helix protein, copG family
MARDRIRCNFYCDAPLMAQLRHLAADREMTVSQGIRACLAEYFALRAELAAAVLEPGQLGDEQSGILHHALSRSEARLAMSVTAQGQQLERLQREMQVLQAMLDRAVLMYLLHTTEVPAEHRQSADASGKRRHEQWYKAVTRVLQSGALAVFTTEEDTHDPHPTRRKTTAAG